MKIDDEIKQKKFRNEYQKATLNLIYTSNWLLSRHKIFFSKFRITEQQYNVLRILRGQHPDAISTSEIKKRMLDMNSDTSRIVDRLELKAFVNKKICKHDRRLVDVSISGAGLKLLDRIDRYVSDLDNIIANLSVKEAEHLNFLLDKMRG
jgi:DNA-binding MarR family transcriptional regulator